MQHTGGATAAQEMFLKLLKSVFSFERGTGSGEPGVELPAERMQVMRKAHTKAPRERHLRILFDDMKIGGESVVDLAERCIRESGAESPPLKAFHRPLASYFLARYFLYSLDLPGERAECGVFSGASALLMCRAAGMRRQDFDGRGLHLVDSFAGISEPADEDLIPVREKGGDIVRIAGFGKGALASPLDIVKRTLKDYPGVKLHAGWIPDVFAQLPESPWAFIHIDVDLYEPTLACLEYFYPRLTAGGVIVCDDYGAPLFPGAHRAWDYFCAQYDVPYIVLDTGQSIILRQSG